jgi:hypothetical protein
MTDDKDTTQDYFKEMVEFLKQIPDGEAKGIHHSYLKLVSYIPEIFCYTLLEGGMIPQQKRAEMLEGIRKDYLMTINEIFDGIESYFIPSPPLH